MAHRAAKREVVADLSRLAEEIVVVEKRAAVAGGAAAGDRSVEVVAVTVDQRLDEVVVRRLPRDRQRHGEQTQLVQIAEIQARTGSRADRDVRDVVRTAVRQEREVGELARHVAPVVDDPGGLDDPDLLAVLGAASGACRGVGRVIRRARVDALRTAVTAVDQDRTRRRERELAEPFVPGALVLRESAVQVRARVPRVLGPVVRTVEEQAILEDRSSDVRIEPAAVRLVPRLRAAREVGRHVLGLKLIAELTGIPARSRLADRVDRETARPIEVHRAGTALDDRDLRDVVRRRLRRERAKERQRHVDAIELIHVVLTAAAGARAARLVLRELHRRNQPDQISIFLRDGKTADLLGREAALDRRRFLVDERRRRRDGDRLRHALDAKLRIDDGVL